MSRTSWVERGEGIVNKLIKLEFLMVDVTWLGDDIFDDGGGFLSLDHP